MAEAACAADWRQCDLGWCSPVGDGAIVETIRITKPDVATELRRRVEIFDYARMQDFPGR